MKKLLGSTLALAMFLPAGANAEMMKNLKLGGSLEVDAVSANNVTDLNTQKYDHVGTAQTRLMVHGDWDVLDDVHAHLGLTKNNRTYGTGSENAQTVQANIVVDESYVKIDKLFGGLDTTLGRQFYGDSGDLVIYYGPKYHLYGLPVTALDGGRFDWMNEMMGVTVLAAKATGGALATTDNGNVNLRGINVHCNGKGMVALSASLYNRDTVNSGAPGVGGTGAQVVGNDHLYVADLKGKVTMGGLWAKAEFAKDFGSNRTVNGNGSYAFTGNYTGWAGLLDLGYKLDLSKMGALTAWAQGGIGSGGTTANRNFTAIAGDYRPGSIAGRFAAGSPMVLGNATIAPVDNGTLSNRTVLGAGVKVTPSMLAKLTAGLSWWNYRYTTVAGVPAAAKGNKMLGNEYDLDLSWTHSENVMVGAGVGSYQPGNALTSTNGATTNPATLAYADFSIKF